MSNPLHIIHSLLPYQPPFLFVDEFTALSDDSAKGTYRFRDDEYFYSGHFPDRAVTPGVILTECMAQIGLVGLGMWLLQVHENPEPKSFVFTSSEVEFLMPVFPGETVYVESEKLYFRLNKLKAKVWMNNEAGEMTCKGTLAGMMISRKDAE